MVQFPKGEIAPADGSIPESALVDVETRTFHAYVHVPYCEVKCGYCDFNTYTADEIGTSTQGNFAKTLISEIELAEQVLETSGFPKRECTSVFFGGGTPTMLPASNLIEMLAKLKSTFRISEDADITTEANPDSVDEEYIAALKAGGFNRISFGMQSAVPHVLKVLERTHKPENVGKVVGFAKAVGLATSVDLIYGAPGESLDDWRQTLEAAIALDTDHISAYSLIVEPGTKLARQVRLGEVPEPSDDMHADMYELTEVLLSQAGFFNYEVSNWSKSVKERSGHNMAYWKSMDWWGFGPGAHSHVGGVRWWNVKNPAAYSDRMKAGVSPALEREIIDHENRDIEKVMLETRISDGISLDWLKSKGFADSATVAGLIADQLIEAQTAIKGTIVLTAKGRLLADSVVLKLLG
jgi:oxygen-independent coproporphyrinogen-3 oxidase